MLAALAWSRLFPRQDDRNAGVRAGCRVVACTGSTGRTREVTDAGRKRFCLCLPPRSLGLVCPLIGLRSQTRQADVPRRLVYTLLLQTHRCRLRCGRLSAHTDKTPRDELRTRLGESDTRSPPRNRPQSVSKCDTGGGETQATAV